MRSKARSAVGALAAILAFLPAAVPALGGEIKKEFSGSALDEEQAFQAACQLYQELKRDKIAAVEAFERFIKRFPDSPRAADAQFMTGESYLESALPILKSESASKKSLGSRLDAPQNAAALDYLEKARQAFSTVVGRYRRKQAGLSASAQYRLGEVAYNSKDWAGSIDGWGRVDKDFGKTYIVPEAWMGVIFANLALEQFSQAEANLFQLGETHPNYLKVPEVLYAQGIVSLHKGDYTNAERALRTVNTPEAQFYLGKTFLLSKRPFLAAATFEQLIRDFPKSVLREETEFFIGDSFFLAKDFDGAITKYNRFIEQYPESPLKVSALFRIGSAYFQKRKFPEARAHFQAVIDRYPKDFFAPLAQYFIAESYLTANQFREALFAYTRVITSYPDQMKISPLATYKLAWSQYQVGDFVQCAQTCRNFIQIFPTNSLAKNVHLILGNALLQLKQYPDALTALQRVIDLSPTSDVAEQALLAILQMHHKQKAYNSILTSYQYIFRHLPPSQSKWRPMSYLYAAEAYLEMNRVEEAKSIYEMILKVYPNDVSAFYAQDGLAWSYSYLGDDARALEERRKLKDLLQLAKSSSTMTGANELAIADSMFNQKEFEEAQELYQKYASENPKAPEAPQALYRAGMSLYHLRYFTDAISRWRQLCEAYPEAPESQKAVFQIADTLFRAQKFQEAVAAYRRIIEKYPDNDHLPLAFLRIAQAAFNSKDDAGTVRGCQALLDRFPTAPEAVDALDLMESALDRSPAMDFKQALGAVGLSSPRSAAAGDAQFRIARRLFEAKRFGEAASEFQKYSVDFTGGPHLKKAQFLLAEAYLNAGKNSEAVFAFQRFLDNFPKSEDTPLAVFHLAGAFYAQKEFDSAAQQYQRVLDDFPDSEYGKLALYNLALSYKAAGNSEKAQDAYSRYASQASGDPKAAMAALWEIFDLQKDQKKFGEALGTIERILNYGPDPETVIEATYQQGAVLILMNQPEDALRSWEKLLAMTPKASNYRLQGLIQLGEVYEQAKDWAKAVPVYDDISANASTPQMAKGAKDRADALRAMLQGKAAPSETVAPTAPPPAPPQPVKPPEAPPAADKKPPVKPAAAKKPAKARKAKEPGTN